MAGHLAQVNVARLLAPIDDPRIDEFRDALERVNALAESSDGFVWRLVGDAGLGATDLRWPAAPDDPLTIVNLSVWTDLSSLRAFVYRSDHAGFLRRRRTWFEPASDPTVALWWVPPGHRPNLAEAAERLTHLRAHGPTPHAFTPRSAPVAAERA